MERQLTEKERTQIITGLRRRHPKARCQESYHGANRYSVQFFARRTGVLVADYMLPETCETAAENAAT